MAEFDGPTFSLGFELDLDDAVEESEIGDGADRKIQQEEVSCSEEDVAPSGPPFKRLRKGADPSTPVSAVRSSHLDDDIEEFSSQEDCVIQGEPSSRQVFSSCSSSKVSLHGQRVLNTINSKNSKSQKITPTPRAGIPTSVEASSSKRVFPRLTLSPLKRIHLLDSNSDSDSDSDSEDRPEAKGNQQWKNPRNTLSPAYNPSLRTPAFDLYCEDYFQSRKVSGGITTPSTTTIRTPLSGMSSATTSSTTMMSAVMEPVTQNESCSHEPRDHQPPWHQYFFHADARVQNLVRRRLSHFVPTGDMKSAGCQQTNAETFDYMGQFGQKKVHELSTKESPAKSRKKEKVARVPDNSAKSKSKGSVSGSTGHWYTGQDGKKVYVTKNGQEMSGRTAYMRYRKESGRSRKKGRKASGSKRKKSKK
ncbi:rho GTPase-activating protein isoform X2 [Wolffia australiana]